MRADQKVRGKYLPFLHRLINRAGITSHNTATDMQLIGYNMLDVSPLRALQLSSRHFTLHFDVLLHNQLNFNIL